MLYFLANGGMVHTLFAEIAAVIVLAGALSIAAQYLRQPLIVAYIATGIIVGPGVLGLVSSLDIFHALSQLGIAFLLFLVGLNLRWQSIKDVGRVAILGGIGQVIVTSLIGLGIAQLLGFDFSTSLFIGVAFSFSSTIIIVKLLSDKEDLDRLYGRVAVGMLIVQDLIAMFALLALAAMGGGESLGTVIGWSVLKGVLVIVVLLVLARVVLPRIFGFAARSQELLFLLGLAWCFGVAAVLSAVGFGIEIGALLAGISLAASGFQHEIEAKIRPLRDFFLVVFFIVLGTGLTVGAISSVIVPALIMSVYVLIGNPLLAMLVMRFLGYHPRTAFLVGTTVAQISEFSFILLAAGAAIGLVDGAALPLATLVAMITITASSYMVISNEAIYERIEWLFRWMEPKHPRPEHRAPRPPEVILCGYHRMGERILPELFTLKRELLVIDYNPRMINALTEQGVPCLYGDVGNDDVLQFVRAEKAKLIVATIPDMEVNFDLLDYLRAKHFHGSVIVTAKNSTDAEKCYDLGASYVIVPSVLGGEAFREYLQSKKLARSAWQALAAKHHKMFGKA